jgi:hypothetical protein
MRVLAWPFTGEIQHTRQPPDDAAAKLREMANANRDQSGRGM